MFCGVCALMWRKLNCAKRTERGEKEREPDGIPGPALVIQLFLCFWICFYILKNKTKQKTPLC